MMIYTVFTPDELHWATFTQRSRAEMVLRLFRMLFDESSELMVAETDENAEEIDAGLKPWLITIELQAGRMVDKPQVELCWPPVPEGITRQDDGLIQYFVWAPTQAEAVRKIPSLKNRVHENLIKAEV